MENQKSLMLPDSNYVVCYFNQRFTLTMKEAQLLMKATEEGAKIVKFDNKVLSTSFSWIVPEEQVVKVEITAKELALAEKIAEWIARPVNDSKMSYPEALNYSKKILANKGFEESLRLWNIHANGAYPSVTKFMLGAKE